MRGDSKAAKSYLSDARSARYQANNYRDFSVGPTQDVSKCDEECNFLANKLTVEPKKFLLMPIFALEAPLRWITGTNNARKEDWQTMKAYKTITPFQQALETAKKNLGDNFKILEGESSDEEWIDGHDPVKKGKSTYKGLRHPYTK